MRSIESELNDNSNSNHDDTYTTTKKTSKLNRNNQYNSMEHFVKYIENRMGNRFNQLYRDEKENGERKRSRVYALTSKCH